jgi:hypothetical protein
MAMWDGTFEPFVCDNHTLLRAINMEEGHEEKSHIIESAVLNKSSFEVIRDNGHLRGLLKDFLIAEIAYVARRKILLELSRVKAFFFRSEKKTLEEEVSRLKGVRDEAFKKYEMLRKLTDTQNKLLHRIPTA